MNEPAGRSAWNRTVWVLLCGAPLLALSTQSYWIDETLTALKAAEPSLAGWWEQMVTEKMSDLQMPLYMFFVWVWAKLFGTSEWALRAANLPWFLGGLLAFASSFRGAARLLAMVCGVFSAFVWFYLDEARPYAMQLGASLLIVAALRQLGTPPIPCPPRNLWTWPFCAGVGILAGTSLLGVFWCGAALAALLARVGLRRVGELLKAAPLAWVTLALWLGGLAAYYLWTLKVGARASSAGTTDLQNALFIGYELLGFSGLGPGRLEIRAAGLTAFHAHLAALATYGLLIGPMLGWGIATAWRADRRRLLWLTLVVVTTLVSLLAAGWLLHFRLLGRHCAPAFVAGLLVLVLGANEAWQRDRLWSRLMLLGFLAASLASCLAARLAVRHAKDDYRSAAAYGRAMLAAGHTVGWSADVHGAWYYDLPLAEAPGEPRRAEVFLNSSRDSLATVELPEVVIVSKPDLYDVQGALGARLCDPQFRVTRTFTAFAIWQRKGETSTETAPP